MHHERRVSTQPSPSCHEAPPPPALLYLYATTSTTSSFSRTPAPLRPPALPLRLELIYSLPPLDRSRSSSLCLPIPRRLDHFSLHSSLPRSSTVFTKRTACACTCVCVCMRKCACSFVWAVTYRTHGRTGEQRRRRRFGGGSQSTHGRCGEIFA